MRPLLLIGAGGHARSLIDLIETQGEWHIQGLIGLPEQVGSTVLSYPVLGTDDDLPTLRSTCPAALLGLGQLPDPALRQRLASQLKHLDFLCPVVVSPHAVVSRHAILGEGSVVGHGAIVNAGAAVGVHCTVNTRALIEHDAQVGDHCHLSTGSLVNGVVQLGTGCFIGSGAMLREGLQLPAGTVISAGKRVMGWPLL